MTNLDSVLKSRDITLLTKARLVKAMVFPVVMYGFEGWTSREHRQRRCRSSPQPWPHSLPSHCRLKSDRWGRGGGGLSRREEGEARERTTQKSATSIHPLPLLSPNSLSFVSHFIPQKLVFMSLTWRS